MLNPWRNVIEYPLGLRETKPRRKGLTMVIDKGLGEEEIRSLLEAAGSYLDHLKLGFGTSALYDEELLRAKIKLCRQYNVSIYPGGTLMETAFWQGRYEAYLERAGNLGFDTIEISDGTIFLDHRMRRYCIRRAVGEGFTVLTEVGKKTPGEEPSTRELLDQGREDLAAGAWKVIMEARESGKGIGIYDQAGQVIAEKLHDFVLGIGEPTAVIWEAPLKAQQVELISRFGPDVNLGNIQPDELLALETLRAGLRGDTLRLAIREKAATACTV